MLALLSITVKLWSFRTRMVDRLQQSESKEFDRKNHHNLLFFDRFPTRNEFDYRQRERFEQFGY